MYDVIVLGGGPGGYKAAELSGKAGLKTVLIEKEHLGGMCLNRGCIPTKAYYSDIIGKRGAVENMWDKKNQVVETLRGGISQLMKLNNVDVIYGEGTIVDTNDIKKVEVKVGQDIKEVRGKNLIIAVGSICRQMDFENNDLDEIITGDYGVNREDLWNSDEVKSVAIAGAGVIAIEFAFMLKALGKDVTILKHSDQILRKCDIDIKKKLKSIIRRNKINTIDYFEIEKVEKIDDSLVVYGNSKKGPQEVKCERLILCSSLVPIVDGYGLENTDIEYSEQGIKVNEFMRTNKDGVYAIGDVTGGMMLAHVAEYEAMAAIDNIIGKDYTVDYKSVPACVFAEPEIAYVGITEQEAEGKGMKIQIGKSHFMSNGMALAMNDTTGFVKVIADENGKLIGTHIMGPEASALISEAALGIYAGLTVEQVAKCVHPHPTLSECFKDALFNVHQ
ncbi:dihydrolipoyl dehydrogenase family protein [Clostridium sp. Cult2]|uniref:dihydrolipoyl dehydrogenase family protein n=1 Tax=Clostridium sp. Cult2 TaxID=2079003 RepID=UPI001F34828B|nr:NAD(P)/FAD-dependent oxidoreductase [Clostridium sp. Cult2]MCF6465159.1 acetoin dehydrogenase [Clostridium sp. Cult2]